MLSFRDRKNPALDGHRYADLMVDDPRVNFNAPAPIQGNLEETPEGYLLCRDVALARTGLQIYMGYEVPLEPGPDGTITVERTEDEVFRPETIASFHGKPFTDDHPTQDVGPSNYRNLMAGVILNPRRGTGAQAHLLLGDVLVYDAVVKRRILDGKREVSCGYDADYHKLEPGRGRQVNILGNHVSLVREGRCGSTCRINDERTVMATPAPGSASSRLAAFRDGIMSAFRAKDETELTRVLDGLPADVDAAGEGNAPVVVHVHGAPPAAQPGRGRDAEGKKGDKDGEEEEDMDEADKEKARDARVAQMITDAVAAAVKPLNDTITELRSNVTDQGDRLNGLGATVDSSSSTVRDTIGLAEIIAPGKTVYKTTDAKPGSSAAREHLTSFMRDTLKEGLRGPARDAIESVAGRNPALDSLSADSIDIVFRNAGQKMAEANNARRGTGDTYVTADGQERKRPTPASWNDANRKFWGDRKSA